MMCLVGCLHQFPTHQKRFTVAEQTTWSKREEKSFKTQKLLRVKKKFDCTTEEIYFLFQSFILLSKVLYFHFTLVLGQFLYLLGRSTSDVANVTDKRIISSLIRESGNNCSLQMHIHYQVKYTNEKQSYKESTLKHEKWLSFLILYYEKISTHKGILIINMLCTIHCFIFTFLKLFSLYLKGGFFLPLHI